MPPAQKMVSNRPRFDKIPQLTRPANYKIDVSWRYLLKHLEGWEERYMDTGLDMDPDFQRGHVWTLEQRRSYVEFMLRGGTGSNIIYFNHPDWMNFRIEAPITLVDGKQRVTSAKLFLRDQLPVFGGWVFSDFEDEMAWQVGFIFCVNNLKTREEVIRWYLEMNYSGTPHSKEELERVRLLYLKETAQDANQ